MVIDYLEKAVAIFEEVKSPHVDQARALLAEWHDEGDAGPSIPA